MGNFKDKVYLSLKEEIDRYENKEENAGIPFLYTYLRRKKEADPRLVILNAYRTYLRDGCKEAGPVVAAAKDLFSGAHRTPGSAPELEELPRDAEGSPLSPAGCRRLVESVRAAFPYNEKRNDRYVQLRERDLLFQCEAVPDQREYFLFLLRFALSYVQPITEEIFAAFSAIWETIRCSAHPPAQGALPPGGKLREFRKKRLKALCALAQELPPDVSFAAIPGESLCELSEMMQLVLIRTDAAAWMYDAGYSGGQNREALRPRKADHTMDLLDAYFEERGADGEFAHSSPAVFDLDRERGDIERLFQILDKSRKYRNVILPLTIDPESGTGLYIVGMNHFGGNILSKGFREYRRDNHNCCYNVIIPSEISPDGVNASLSDYETGQLHEDCLDEAYIAFSAYVESVEEEAYYFYQDYNGKAPAQCPQAYQKYFKKNGEKDVPYASEEKHKIKTERMIATATGQIPN